MKLIADPITFLRQPMNQFDLLILILSLVGSILDELNLLSALGTSTSVFRTFRIIRILRLVKRAKSIRVIFMTFIYTLPALINIGALLCICLFMFGILGMNLYPYLKHGQGIKQGVNFESFSLSFWTLFKSAGGEDWNLILADTGYLYIKYVIIVRRC